MLSRSPSSTPARRPAGRARLVPLVGAVVLALAAAGCGEVGSEDAPPAPLSLPTGPGAWDASAPAWLLDGVLHVGGTTLSLGPDAESFVLGATGVYWAGQGDALMFTDTEGRTEEVAGVDPRELAVSADHTVLAAVDRTSGPVDEYGTHVRQAVALDTRTGRQVYRTPDAEPDDGTDLADLYEEISPLLRGVSAERLFFDGATVDLASGRTVASSQDVDGESYAGFDETLFLDGYRVDIEGEGSTRRLADAGAADISGTGRLSPDRTTIFDLGSWPTPAVVYDAATGQQRAIEAPWDHFVLGGFSADGSFFGIAQQIDEGNEANIVRAQQVVSCSTSTLACTPVSEELVTDDTDSGAGNGFVLEVGADRF